MLVVFQALAEGIVIAQTTHAVVSKCYRFDFSNEAEK